MDVIHIGFCGVKGSGKSTLSDMVKVKLAKKGYMVVTLPFAQGIKETMAALVSSCTGMSIEDSKMYFYTPDMKEIIIPSIGVSAREMMVKFGTDFVRDINEDLWIKYIEAYSKKLINMHNELGTKKLAIMYDDIRFTNEYNHVQAIGRNVFIARTYDQAYPSFMQKIKNSFNRVHVSEKGLYHLCNKHELIINNSTLEHLDKCAEEIVSNYE